jgi:hypothetical protein
MTKYASEETELAKSCSDLPTFREKYKIMFGCNPNPLITDNRIRNIWYRKNLSARLSHVDNLLHANELLRKEIEELKLKLSKTEVTLTETEQQRQRCVQSCQIKLSEKDRIIQEKEQRFANLKSVAVHLRNAKWSYRITEIEGGLKIEDTIMFQ